MVAVDDQTGHQLILGELIPDVVGVAADSSVGSIAQMRAHPSPGIHGRPDLVRVGNWYGRSRRGHPHWRRGE